MAKITRKTAVFVLNYAAGWVDATGYLALVGAVQAFPSFMSGNSTKIVTDLVSGNFLTAALIAGVVFLFITGTIIARLLNDGTRRRETAALFAVAAGLWLAVLGKFLGWSHYALLCLFAFDMGMINRALQGSKGHTVHTFISGAVVSIGSDIADAISGRGKWRQALLPLSIWSAILLGALSGGLVMTNIGLRVAMIVPAIVITGMAIINWSGRLELASEPKEGHAGLFEAYR